MADPLAGQVGNIAGLQEIMLKEGGSCLEMNGICGPYRLDSLAFESGSCSKCLYPFLSFPHQWRRGITICQMLIELAVLKDNLNLQFLRVCF